MSGFKTEKSIYYFDPSRRIITGGIFGINEESYTRLVAIIGCEARVDLADGRQLITKPVVSYV